MSVRGVSENSKINQVDDIHLVGGAASISSDVLIKAINNAHTEIMNLSSFSSKRKITYDGLREKIDVTHLPYYDNKHRYRFQGFTVTEDYIYITAHGKEDDPSVILIYDKDGKYLGLVKLPDNAGRHSHVGGISYDSEHNHIYITDKKGKVLVLDNDIFTKGFEDNIAMDNKPFKIDLNNEEDFDLDAFVVDNSINLKKAFKKYLKKHNINNYEIDDSLFDEFLESINVLDDSSSLSAASVYYDEVNHKVYVPTFSRDSKIFVYDVSFDSDGNPEYTLDDIYGMGNKNNDKIDDVNLPYGLQGVATYTDSNGDTYLLMVSSYGSIDSCITKYKINSDGSIEFAGQHVFCGEKGLENIVVDSETGEIFCNFENYAGGTKQDGSEFKSINIDDINGSSADPGYIDVMRKMRGAASSYER